MSTDAAELFFSVLALVAAAGTVGLVVLRLTAPRSPAAAGLLADVGRVAVWLAFGVAVTATLGSLYFSEIADYVPCRLCWFQRIAMYPLAVVLLVGALLRDRTVRAYAAPLAVIGALVAAYHYLIEWRPELDTGACDASGPPCTAIWFREFGFVTLAFMALVGFVAVLALLFLTPLDSGGADPEREAPSSDDVSIGRPGTSDEPREPDAPVRSDDPVSRHS